MQLGLGYFTVLADSLNNTNNNMNILITLTLLTALQPATSILKQYRTS